MPRSQNPKCHQEEVEHFGVAVQVKQLTPNGNLYVEHRHFDERFRKSLRTKDLEEAREWAREHCKEIALQKEGGALGAAVRSNRITLGELFDAFRERGLPKYEKTATRTHCLRLRLAMRLLEAVWGRGLVLDHLNQEHIDDFVALREEKGIEVRSDGNAKRYQPVSRRTTLADLQGLSAIVSWAMKQRYNGRWMLPDGNPLDHVDLPEEQSAEEISQPIADEERYRAELEFASRLGKTSRHRGRRILPMMLRLVRHTGRRLQAVQNLRWKDICVDRDSCEAALREDQAPVRRARSWPFGAIRWRREHNKMNYGSVIPIREALQEALIDYRAEVWPDLMAEIAGDDWSDRFDEEELPLFPSPQEPGSPVSEGMPHRWLKAADELAREAGHRGAPPEDEKQGGFHAYRRWWVSERGHFASDENRKAVRIAGSWKPSGDTMRRVYLQISPTALYRVVCNEGAQDGNQSVVSLETLGMILQGLAEEGLSDFAAEQLNRLSEMNDEDRRTFLWSLVRAAEKSSARPAPPSSEDEDSQDLVKLFERAG